MLNPRSVIEAMLIYYDKEDPSESERALQLYNELAEVTVKMGYQQYRTCVAYMDRILAEAPGFRRVSTSIKAALDPTNTVAPGRYGIGIPDSK